MKKFFIVCPLGFEKGVEVEMRRAWPLLLEKSGQKQASPFPELRVLKGGIEFEADEFVGLQLNFFLKTASRVLLRLAEFKVRDFPKLHERIKKIPWAEHFRSSAIEFKVAASGSRLNNEKRLQETLRKTLEGLLPTPAAASEPEGTLYLRLNEDLCTLSLDTTGEHLHKRGWGTLKGEAPLRETIAHFILSTLMTDAPAEKLKTITLLDPMMGSGTFLTEARAGAAPQFHRSFAFQKLKSCPKLFLSPQFPLNYRLEESGYFKSYRGNDVDFEMVEVTRANFAELEKQLQSFERKEFQPADFETSHRDLFADDPWDISQPLWIVTNPPYGERLREATREGLADYVETLSRLGAEKIALLYPERGRLSREDVPAGYRLAKEIAVLNGGLKTRLTVLERESS